MTPRRTLGTLLLLLSPAAHAVDPVQWVDWTAIDVSNDVVGTVTVDATAVEVRYSGERAFVQTSCGTDYFNPTAPYVSATVPNAPIPCDIIALSQATAKQLTFSQPVTNPLFAVVSLNGNGYRFDRDFEILSTGTGYYGAGTLTKQITTNPDGSVTYDLIGTGEPHGVLQFVGTFSSVSWTSLSNEFWNGFTIGVERLAAAVPPEIEVFNGDDVSAPEVFDAQVSPIDFGSAAAVEGLVRSLTIANTGTGPLNLSSVRFEGAHATLFDAGTFPPAVAAGGSTTLSLAFTPVVGGTFTATLVIDSDDADEPAFEVPVIASAFDADRDGVPDDVDACEGDDASGDSDGDGLCDDTDFTLSVGELVYPGRVSLSVANAPAGVNVRLFATRVGTGSGPCAPNDPTLCLDLRSPKAIGLGVTDANGAYSTTVRVPPSVASLSEVWFQALWEIGLGVEGDVSDVERRDVLAP